MTILSYNDTTTRGADPTQIETWVLRAANGIEFTVTQFFGDYLIEIPGEPKRDAPQWLVARLNAFAERANSHKF